MLYSFFSMQTNSSTIMVANTKAMTPLLRMVLLTTLLVIVLASSAFGQMGNSTTDNPTSTSQAAVCKFSWTVFGILVGSTLAAALVAVFVVYPLLLCEYER